MADPIRFSAQPYSAWQGQPVVATAAPAWQGQPVAINPAVTIHPNPAIQPAPGAFAGDAVTVNPSPGWSPNRPPIQVQPWTPPQTTVPAQPSTPPATSQPGATSTVPSYPAVPGNGYPPGGYIQPANVDITYLANDYRRPVDYTALRLAQRLQSLGVRSTQDLLERAGTPSKREWLIRMCAAFDDRLTTQNVRQYLQRWLSSSDLLRTGMSLDTATSLQAVGIWDTPSLARYYSPWDKTALYGSMSNLAIQYGYRLPPWHEFSASVDNARRMPIAIRW